MQFITVEKAYELVLQNTLDFGTEEIPFLESVERVLAEDILADRDFPPFDRVTMDGVAIRADDYERGNRKFKIDNIQFAGEPALKLEQQNACIEVMTGCSLPANTDSVIRYEDIVRNGGYMILQNDLQVNTNIHYKGYDRKLNEIVLPKGHQIKSPDLGILATVGKSIVKVKKQPNVAILTSGDELVEVDVTPLPHQIRKSNIFVIASSIKPFCAKIAHFHLADDLTQTLEKIKEIEYDFDVLILSGGVSEGKKDLIPTALEQLNYTRIFHKIRQRPGKPMWFGRKENKIVFALPGNPVSAFMCACRYLKPWLLISSGIQLRPEKAILSSNINFKPELTYLMQVKLENQEGQLMAIPVEGHGSGDLANLSDADAFLELPLNASDLYQAGISYNLWRF